MKPKKVILKSPQLWIWRAAAVISSILLVQFKVYWTIRRKTASTWQLSETIPSCTQCRGPLANDNSPHLAHKPRVPSWWLIFVGISRIRPEMPAPEITGPHTPKKSPKQQKSGESSTYPCQAVSLKYPGFILIGGTTQSCNSMSNRTDRL